MSSLIIELLIFQMFEKFIPQSWRVSNDSPRVGLQLTVDCTWTAEIIPVN